MSIVQGLAVLAVVIAVGFLLARFRVLPENTQEILARLVFFVATPALLMQTLSKAPVGEVFSAALGVTAIATAVGGLGYFALSRWWFRATAGESTIGAVASCYVNAGNLGIPLTSYLFGTATYVAPVMMYQLIVLAPIAFVMLDLAETGQSPSLKRVLLQPVRNPIVVASLLGVGLALSGWQLPEVVAQPINLIAGLAVPGALIAYGMSLHGAPIPGKQVGRAALGAIMVMKMLVLPATAYLVARFIFGMHGEPLLAATLCAALPTAQNVFVYAVRYRTAVPLARDAVLATTVAAVPVLIAIVALVHG
nr:AEC family transporter [Nakamurella aerolata]